MKGLFDELATGSRASQTWVLILVAVICLPIVDLVPLHDDCLEPAIIGLIERHMVHLRKLKMIVMLRYVQVLQVIGLLGVRIDRPLSVCRLDLGLIVLDELLKLLLLSCDSFLFLSNNLSLFFLLLFDSLAFSFSFSFDLLTFSLSLSFYSLSLCFSFSFNSITFGLSFNPQPFSFFLGFLSQTLAFCFLS